MFYKKPLSIKNGDEKEFEFDMFGYSQNLATDATELKVGQPQKVYNFISADGTLKAGYGFKIFCMPEDEEDIENEVEVPFESEIQSIWNVKFYDNARDKNSYFIFYFDGDNTVRAFNLFQMRIMPLYYDATFTNIPYVTYYRQNKKDALLLSGEGGNLVVISSRGTQTSSTAPRIISCCSHNGKLFAITAEERGTLVYNENLDILQWEDEKTKDLDFSDTRGDLNRIVDFNDYLYIFRDFGITRVGEYGADEHFEICHIYQSDAYIYPNTIAQTGDRVLFLEGSKIKFFNGGMIREIELDSLKVLEGCDNKYASGECFEGKYYLACRGNFDDGEQVGCEKGEYRNNLLIVLDTTTLHVDITRGVDINKILALQNSIKSKLVACFYNQNKSKVGEISTLGKNFDETLKGGWTSGKTDFGYSGKLKRIKSFNIKSEGDCTVTFTSERQTKSFKISGKSVVQKIRANVLGNLFTVKIENDSDKVYISNFVLTVSCG